MHVAERVIKPRTPKNRDKNPPRMATPFAKKRTHLKKKFYHYRRNVVYHGKAAFGSCSACICVLTPDAAAPIVSFSENAFWKKKLSISYLRSQNKQNWTETL